MRSLEFVDRPAMATDPRWPLGRAFVALAALVWTACGSVPSENSSRPVVENKHPDAAAEVSDARATADVEAQPDAEGDADASTTLPDRVAPAFPDPSAVVGAGALNDFDSLPFLRLDEQSRHTSSYDRSGGNADYGNAYGVDAAGNGILLDARGPGCVYRIWFTGFKATDQIHVYFDDETTPRIDMSLATFFGGDNPPFAAPLVGDAVISSGGFFSYVPLPFAKSIRITATPNASVYFNIDYHTLPAGDSVATWTGAEDLSAVRAVWAAPGSDPKRDAGGTAVESTFDLVPKETRPLFNGVGPGEISALELRIPGVVPPTPDGGTNAEAGAAAAYATDVLDHLWLNMSWDGESSPSVLAPVGSLFALGDLGPGASGGLMAGMRADGTLYLYFPMPFSANALVTITNSGDTPVTGLWARIETQPFPFSYDDVGTFAVQYLAGNSTRGAELTLLDTSGSGKVVGTVVTEKRQACSDCSVRDYLEGNEHVLVDGARTPVVLGTGTEDFFNGGFYFLYGPFGLPSHGNTVHEVPGKYDATAMYRFFVSDAISFRSHVRLSLQHGPTDNDDVVASSLVYYYRQPRARLELTDAFVVGDPVGERDHGYQITGATWSGSVSATFEGEFSTQSFSSTGRAHKGTSTFVAQIDPANDGVVLRRLLDQATGNQRAHVFANGTLVGDWLTPGSNSDHAWREEDFVIPGSITAGKSSVSIEISFVSSDSDWNEFQYETYSQFP